MSLHVRNLPVLVALGCIALAGCSKGSDTTTTTTTTTTVASPDAGTAAAPAATAAKDATTTTALAGAGDAAHGKAIFSANCASCHGANGTEGGVGPSLKNEKAKKNLAATVAWIKNPQPPMPKLYPSPLSAKDVTDVATFVQSL